jgi:hypothetical protein
MVEERANMICVEERFQSQGGIGEDGIAHMIASRATAYKTSEPTSIRSAWIRLTRG